jgi:tetratricopeptide repeat protein
MSRRAGDKIAVARSLEHLADVYLASESDGTRASALYEESLLLHEETRDIYRLRAVLGKLATIARRQGDYERARTLARRVLVEAQNMVEQHWKTYSLARIGGLELAQGRPERAARLLAAGDEIRYRTLVGGITPHERVEFERDIAAVRTQLGEAAFATAWEEGKAMSPDEAIAYALADTEA